MQDEEMIWISNSPQSEEPTTPQGVPIIEENKNVNIHPIEQVLVKGRTNSLVVEKLHRKIRRSGSSRLWKRVPILVATTNSIEVLMRQL
jgi:hypothetical protein